MGQSQTTVPNAVSAPNFVPYPAFLLAGLTWEQRLFQQRIYQQAWEAAARAVSPVRPLRVRAAELPRAWRN